MAPRHARADDDTTGASVSTLRLVESAAGPGPGVGRRPGPEPPEEDVSPEVRAVLDAVAALHMAVIGWAAATVDDIPGDGVPPVTGGRHRQ